MQRTTIYTLLALLLLTGMLGVSCQRAGAHPEEENEQYSDYERDRETEEGEENEEEEEEEESGAARQLSGWFQAKGYPNPSNLSARYLAGWEQHQELIRKTEEAFPRRTESASNWTQLGYNLDNSGNRIGGRVVCMAIDPNNTNNLWVGSASGGIWRSTNAGSSWTAVPTGLPVLGVSSILVDPSNSNTIYAGTGEVYHTEVPVMGFNVWKTRGTYGIGVIKSTNGGTSWGPVMSKVSSDLFAIQSMAFQPGNSSTIYACATDGLYRSTNAGNSWTRIYTGINVRDIAINPSNTDQIVIAVGNMTNPVKGIFRTTNGNAVSPTWAQVTTGLPASFQGSIKLDNVGSGELIASIGISSNTDVTNLATREIYRSTNFGSSWTVIGGNTAGTSTNHCSYQFWFAHTVAINPFATDSILFGGVSIYRYRVSTTVRSTAISGIHADHHDIKFDPTRRGTIYVCNDGGVYKSVNGGTSFTAINNGLNATQYYASLGVSRTNANRMAGGLQDNGQTLFNGTNWVEPSWSGGDGTSCAIHPSNDNIILVSRDARQIRRSSNGGTTGASVTSYWGFAGDSRTGFVAPLAFAPSNGSIVYQGSDNIHISSDAGASFSNNTLGGGVPPLTPSAFIEQRHKTAIALAVSPTNSSKIYVSTSPYAQYDNDNNNIYVTGQPNVLRTTSPATTPYPSIKGSLPDRFVMDFAISRNNDDSVYVVLGGFGTAHVYLTPDGGTTWLSRSAGLPDVPFNAILIDPINQSTIYAGSDFGVYVSPDRGVTWYDYSTGFYDATLVMDLQLDANNKLIAATHGKGVFRSDLYSGSTLPVTLTDFRGTSFTGYNRLDWTVEQELNFSHYVVERSADGVQYTALGTIAGAQRSAYQYTDRQPLAEGYYRLKLVDLDGSVEYSTVVLLRQSQARSSFAVAGNPFRDEIVLQYRVPDQGNVLLQLHSASGALVRRETLQALPGTGLYTLQSFSLLAPGVYFLRVQYRNEMETIRLVKQ